MNDNFQSGKTQAIDLDELHVESANRPHEVQVRGEFELDRWGDDPWSSTEESRKRRRWAEDDRWAGDDEEQQSRQEDAWEVDEEKLKEGWNAPKRGDQLETNDGWEDWDNFGGAPKQLEMEQESKDFGGYRRVQAASQYAQEDSSNYVDGHAQREDLYRQKEAFGTSGVRERKGDPYADLGMAPEPDAIKDLVPVGDDNWDKSIEKPAEMSTVNEDDMLSAKIANQNSGGDDIPGVTRASIIIFQVNADPVVYELKKMQTTIGRGLDNMVILNDQYSSRRHLSIHYVNGRFEVFALSNDNLATVNGYPISHVVLMNGDQIEVGATRIRFVLGPIGDRQLQMSAPLNGKPCHIDPPPQEVRSPKTTRKNLILLISVVGVLVILLIVGLFIIGFSSKPAEVKPEIADADIREDEEKAAADESREEKEQKKEAPVFELGDVDNIVLEGLFEGFSAATAKYSRGQAPLFIQNEVTIQIETTPEGARIYNEDGSFRGLTPYSGIERAPVDYSTVVKIRKDGFKQKEVELFYDSEKVKEVLTLEEEKPAAELKPKPKPKPKSKSRSKSKKKKHSGSKSPSRPGRIMI